MSERVNIRVPSADKEAWDEHVETQTMEGTETPKYDNRSQFIQHAVNEQIKRDKGMGGGSSGETPQTGANTEQVDKLVETVERMSNRVETLEGSVNDATRAMHSGGTVSESTTTQVWEAIPQGSSQATTAEGISEGLDIDASTARIALEQLHENTATVKKREIDTLEEGEGVVTITDHQGRELEIEDPGKGVRRRNPLWWRRE